MGKVKNIVVCISLALVAMSCMLAVSPALSQEVDETNRLAIKNNPLLLISPGVDLLTQGKYEEAESFFKNEMDQADWPIRVEIGLAESLIKQAKFLDAIELLEKLLISHHGRLYLRIFTCRPCYSNLPKSEKKMISLQ